MSLIESKSMKTDEQFYSFSLSVKKNMFLTFSNWMCKREIASWARVCVTRSKPSRPTPLLSLFKNCYKPLRVPFDTPLRYLNDSSDCTTQVRIRHSYIDAQYIFFFTPHYQTIKRALPPNALGTYFHNYVHFIKTKLVNI